MSSTQAAQCPELATKQNFLTAENIASLCLSNYDRSNGTVVAILCCAPSYQIQGNSRVTCVNGSWTPQVPVCVSKPSFTTTTPAYNNNNNNNNTKLASSSSSNPYDTVVIITSCMLAIIVLFLLVLLVYKCCTCRPRPSSKVYELPTSTASALPLYTTAAGSHVLHSSFPGSERSWTYLSVDRLIRDIEASRRQNPKHTWRDFATISSYSTKRL